MTLQTEKFIRKVRPVEAVKVTEDNLSAVAGWCGGLVVPAGTIGNSKETYIHVPVRNPRRDSDSQAFVGMWIVKEDFRNCRVVTNKQFRNSYDHLDKPKAPAPKPSVMPKKKVVEVNPGEPTQVGAVEVVPGTPADEGSSLTTGTTVTETIEADVVADEVALSEKENNVNEHYTADELAPSDEAVLVADDLAADVVPGDMVDPEQPEEDEDGTVQLGAPVESPVEAGTPELCGECGSQVVSGVCSKDIEHNLFGQASTDAEATLPRILPGD